MPYERVQPTFEWPEEASHTELLRSCMCLLSMTAEVLRRPDEEGNGADFVMSNWGAAGLAMMLSAVESALAALATDLADQAAAPPPHRPARSR